MKNYIKYYFILYFLVIGKIAIAQQSFFLESNIAEKVSAATYLRSQNTVLFFSGNNVFFYPFGSQASVTPEWYKLNTPKNIDAALEWDEENSLFFTGTSYRMFKHSTGEFVSDEAQWPQLPATWNNQLDGAVRWDNNLVFFFFRNEYVIYNIQTNAVLNYDIISNWQGWPLAWSDGIDDAFNPGDGFIYFIRRGEIMPYSLAEKTFFIPQKIATLRQANQALSRVFDENTAPIIKNESTNVNTISNPTQAKPNLGGCIIGAFEGGKEMQSPIEGNQIGSLFSDALTNGYKVLAIKIYTSKIWGKGVICGIQTILASASGEQIEQAVLGKQSINEYKFSLNDDECISGINGIKNGEAGGFIYNLQIITTKRVSNTYGERDAGKGSESFTISIPQASLFNGFVVNFDNNITGIGLKYWGITSNNSNQFNDTNIQQNTNVTENNINKTPIAPAENKLQTQASDEYSDNYEDYTINLGNDANWNVQPMPGLDWLGCGFDILRFDPLNPNETKNRKIFRALVVSNSSERAGNKNQFLKPFGTEFGSVNSGSDLDSSSWVASYKSFTNSFNIGVSGSVSVAEKASGSLSGSYSEMNSSSLGSESIYYFSKVLRKIHEIDLMKTWVDKISGQKYKQKIHPSFKEELAKLPIIKGDIPILTFDQLKKDQPLPLAFEQIKGKYLDMIAKYGTHYASHVTWGGQYITRTQIMRADYESSRMSQMVFKQSAEATIKKVKVGYSVEFGNSEESSNGTHKSVFRRQTYVQGGNGETDLEKWRDKVDATPAPVEIYFTPYVDLLTKDMFPNDPNIESKRQIMKTITEKYLIDNMRPAIESKNDFFRELPPIPMPGNITIYNGGGYVMKFTINYELNGEMKSKESGSFAVGRTISIEVPVDAKNINLKAEYYTGWFSDTKVIFEQNFAKPDLKRYKVWGTVFSQGYSEY